MRRLHVIPAVPFVLISLSACGSHGGQTAAQTTQAPSSASSTPPSSAEKTSSTTSQSTITSTTTATTTRTNQPSVSPPASPEMDDEFAGHPGLTRTCDGNGTTSPRVRIKGAVSCQLASDVQGKISPNFTNFDAFPGNFTINAYSVKKGDDVPYDCERLNAHLIRCERSKYGGASEVWIDD